jgi:hypothetical protein
MAWDVMDWWKGSVLETNDGDDDGDGAAHEDTKEFILAKTKPSRWLYAYRRLWMNDERRSGSYRTSNDMMIDILNLDLRSWKETFTE